MTKLFAKVGKVIRLFTKVGKVMKLFTKAEKSDVTLPEGWKGDAKLQEGWKMEVGPFTGLQVRLQGKLHFSLMLGQNAMSWCSLRLYSCV